MNDALLMRVLHRLAHAGEQPQPLARREAVLIAEVRDDGVGKITDEDFNKGSGLLGLRERLEFVNGTFDIFSDEGTTLFIKIPKVFKHTDREDLI